MLQRHSILVCTGLRLLHAILNAITLSQKAFLLQRSRTTIKHWKPNFTYKGNIQTPNNKYFKSCIEVRNIKQNATEVKLCTNNEKRAYLCRHTRTYVCGFSFLVPVSRKFAFTFSVCVKNFYICSTFCLM